MYPQLSKGAKRLFKGEILSAAAAVLFFAGAAGVMAGASAENSAALVAGALLDLTSIAFAIAATALQWTGLRICASEDARFGKLVFLPLFAMALSLINVFIDDASWVYELVYALSCWCGLFLAVLVAEYCTSRLFQAGKLRFARNGHRMCSLYNILVVMYFAMLIAGVRGGFWSVLSNAVVLILELVFYLTYLSFLKGVAGAFAAEK